MTRVVVGDDRSQSTLFPERLEDYLTEDNPVRAIDVFAKGLIWPSWALAAWSRRRQEGQLYVYGYLNRVQSSRRLERGECQHNIELVWLTGR